MHPVSCSTSGSPQDRNDSSFPIYGVFTVFNSPRLARVFRSPLSDNHDHLQTKGTESPPSITKTVTENPVV